MRNRDAFGFTLVELVVVFSVMAILGTAGIAAYVSYSRTQALDAASSEVLSMLQTAKSRAQSQVRPTQGVCVTGTLDGYQVTIDPSNNTYKLEIKCGVIVQMIEEKRLPQNVTFQDGLPQVFLFRILTGGVDRAGTVTLTAYEKNKSISVNQAGVVGFSTAP